MSSKLQAAGIGEVLMDVFENGETTLGGAPFNVTFHLHQLLAALSMGEATFVSTVGADEWGRSVRASMTAACMSDEFLSEGNKPTGSALVFEHQGGAGFEIQPDVAWDFIRVSDAALGLAHRCKAVVFGSLSQRSDISRESIRKFVSAVNGHRLYDVNLRQNTVSGVKGYTAEVISESLRLATLVKMNDAELEEVCALLGANSTTGDPAERTQLHMEWLCAEFSVSGVAITRGPKGAMLRAGGKQLQLPDSKLEQSRVHPVGAGDSFAAGLLFGVMQAWEPEYSLELANLLSSWVVLHVSATPPLPLSVLAQVRELAESAGNTKVS